MRVADCAEVGTLMIVDDLPPTHRMEATVQCDSPGYEGDPRHRYRRPYSPRIMDTVDTVTMATHRDVGGTEDMDMVTTKSIREIGSIVVVEMIGMTRDTPDDLVRGAPRRQPIGRSASHPDAEERDAGDRPRAQPSDTRSAWGPGFGEGDTAGALPRPALPASPPPSTVIRLGGESRTHRSLRFPMMLSC